MKEFAKALGLNGVIMQGRPGWQKIYPDLKVARVILIDEIGEQDER